VSVVKKMARKSPHPLGILKLKNLTPCLGACRCKSRKRQWYGISRTFNREARAKEAKEAKEAKAARASREALNMLVQNILP
jgi:hypothetical protein